LVGDFHHLLGVDLETEFRAGRSWRWFETRVNAVMAYPDSLLGRSADKEHPQPAQQQAGMVAA
jgi:hypothetical protein